VQKKGGDRRGDYNAHRGQRHGLREHRPELVHLRAEAADEEDEDEGEVRHLLSQFVAVEIPDFQPVAAEYHADKEGDDDKRNAPAAGDAGEDDYG